MTLYAIFSPATSASPMHAMSYFAPLLALAKCMVLDAVFFSFLSQTFGIDLVRVRLEVRIRVMVRARIGFRVRLEIKVHGVELGLAGMVWVKLIDLSRRSVSIWNGEI